MKIYQLATIANESTLVPFGPLFDRMTVESKRKNLERMTAHPVYIINAATFNEGV